MNVDKLINDAIKGYDEYRKRCKLIEKEAQKYIDFDEGVSCEYVIGTGLSLSIVIPVNHTFRECVCPVVGFFEYAKGKGKLSVDDIKKLSL